MDSTAANTERSSISSRRRRNTIAYELGDFIDSLYDQILTLRRTLSLIQGLVRDLVSLASNLAQDVRQISRFRIETNGSDRQIAGGHPTISDNTWMGQSYTIDLPIQTPVNNNEHYPTYFPPNQCEQPTAMFPPSENV